MLPGARPVVTVGCQLPLDCTSACGPSRPLRRPAVRPCGSHVRVPGRRVGRDPDFNQALDLEPGVDQQPHHLAMRERELDRPPQSIRQRPNWSRINSVPTGASGSIGEQSWVRMLTAIKAQISARAKQPMRFRDPFVRVAPDAGAVLADHQIGRFVLERRRLRIALDQREVDVELVLQRPRGFKLGGRDIDPLWSAPRFASQAET